MRIREATDEDLEGLSKLDAAVFGSHAYDKIALRQLVELFRGLTLISEDDRAALGYALGGIDLDRVGWVLAIGVLPAARGRGTGRALTEEIMVRLRARGVACVRLTVEPANARAIALYERLGFRAESLVPNYFGPAAPRLVMERAL